MKTGTNPSLAIGLTLATWLGATAAQADEPRTDATPLPSWRVVTPIRTAPTSTAAPAPSAPGRAGTETFLNPTNIVAKLEETGLPVKVEGKNNYVVTVKQGTWTAPVTVSLSNGGTSIWMMLIIKKDLPAYDQISGERLARLLEANDEVGPCHFAIDRQTRALKMNVAIPNREMTAEMLRIDLEAFVEKVLSTRNLWAD